MEPLVDLEGRALVSRSRSRQPRRRASGFLVRQDEPAQMRRESLLVRRTVTEGRGMAVAATRDATDLSVPPAVKPARNWWKQQKRGERKPQKIGAAVAAKAQCVHPASLCAVQGKTMSCLMQLS